ncbi:PadR family transcriptional regulator [Cellulomonas sp. 179-A 9B4 NHS]|uniref:PadR family transcriptional regulator n=1 Tax=Cellulomonas sp. 179-A 9B4 NHS TaxID=3142379 RepID=UPI0039A2DC7B
MAAAVSAVAVMVLALLHERARHPYDVFQTLVERGDARLVRVTPGAVYHAVERLERDGLVTAAGTERCGNRPERTTYAATDDGRAALTRYVTAYLADEEPTHDAFAVGLAQAPHLPVDDVRAALTARRDRVAARLATLRARLDEVHAHGLPRRYTLDAEREAVLLAHDVDWLDAVLADLGSDRLDWHAPVPHDALAALAERRRPRGAAARGS